MKVALLIRDPVEQSGSRLRAVQWIPHLEAAGASVRVLPWVVHSRQDLVRYAMHAARLARWADVVVFHKPCQPRWLINAVRRLTPRMLVDFDDAVWAPLPGEALAPWHDRLRVRLVRSMRAADGVLVGSHRLGEWVAASAPAVPVTWMPTCVDLADYPDVKRAVDGPAAVGWIGAGANLGDLETLGPALRRLSGDSGDSKATLTVISDRPATLPGVCSRFVPWSRAGEAAALLTLDIGVMPLRDSDRARGRCGFKAIQYMATGLPVVASPVPGPSEVVEDGVTGLFAVDNGAWEQQLRKLTHDTSLRSELGASGREAAESRYSVQANLPRLLAVLRGSD